MRGFLLLDPKLRRETERRLPVNDAEVDRLRRAAVLGILRHRTDAKNFLGGARVNVLPGAERFDQHGIFGKMRQDAQLDLRIIGGEQRVARLRNKRRANLAAKLGPHGIFCRFGSLELSRPVAAVVWLKLVCRRPVSG